MRTETPLPTPQRRRTARYEALVWVFGLLVLGIWGAELNGHATVCIPTALGMAGCIGCGVGHAAGLALRGDVAASWAEHPMGVVAVIVLLARIVIVTLPSPMFVGGPHGKRLPISAGS